MQLYLDFIATNWWMFLALVVILALLARSYIGTGGVKAVGPMQAIQLMNHQNAVLLDVRTDKEYSEGHIRDSLHIPLGVLSNRADELQDYKSRPLVVVCRSGARSAQACGQLRKLGYAQAHNLAGGMLAWENAQLPVTTAAPKKPGKAPKATAAVVTPPAPRNEVLVYVTQQCPFCDRAIDLLKEKGAHYREVHVDRDEKSREEMERRAGRTSVPQIFIGERHIGGCDDLYALNDQGELDPLLNPT